MTQTFTKQDSVPAPSDNWRQFRTGPTTGRNSHSVPLDILTRWNSELDIRGEAKNYYLIKILCECTML